MSVVGASPFSCGLDPTHTCTPGHVGAKRSLSVPSKRRRAFSSPQRPCRCESLSSQARAASVAASVVTEAQTAQQDSLHSPLVSVENRLRQLEASFRAQSAAELESSQEQQSTPDSASDLEGDFVQLERSWQAQTQASTSGRSRDVNSAVPFTSRRYQKRSSSRSIRRSSRVYAASTRRNRPQSQGVIAEVPSSRCPDSQYCAIIRERLQTEKQRNRISRSLAEADAVSMFLYNLGDSSLLTRSEEGRLSRICQRGCTVDSVTASLTNELQREPTGDELANALPDELHGMSAEALHQVRVNAVEARQLMVQYNLRLVFSLCRKYLGRGVEFADLIPEGITGMVRAIEKFDASKGFKFSTYAHWWIRQAVARCIANHSQVVRVPVHVYDICGKIHKARIKLIEEKRTAMPTHEEIGAELGLTGAKVRAFLKQAEPARSLDSPAYAQPTSKTDSEQLNLMDVVAAEPLGDEPKDNRAKDDVNTLLSTLLPRERNVIRMRYGLHDADGTCMTFNDIGAAYGLSKERVRQIEDKALTKLRSPGRAKLLQSSSR